MVTRAQYKAIKNSLTSSERDIVKYYELEYFLRNRIPSVEEVWAHLRKKYPKIKQITVNYSLNRYPVKQAIRNRGIKDFEAHTRGEITDQQQAAALVVSNFADERPISQKLDSIGVSSAQYYAWLDDPAFRELVNVRAEQNKINIRPVAIAEFNKKIQQGDFNAIKYWMESTGELRSESIQTDLLMRSVIEIIQKHVKDPGVLEAIAVDILAVSQNRPLELDSPPVINADVVEVNPVSSEEVREAQRKIGFM